MAALITILVIYAIGIPWILRAQSREDKALNDRLANIQRQIDEFAKIVDGLMEYK